MHTTCLNCNTHYKGKFCPECGQKSSTHKITFSAILHDIPHSVLHIDKGFFFTFLQLTYRPGKAIKDYLAGMRIRYFSPFAYLLLLCAASSFVRHQAVGYLHILFVVEPHMLFPALAEFFNHYPALMLCMLTPFISFWSWLFNKDKGYNYWENFILNTYIIAQFNLFFIINNLLLAFGIYTSGSVTPILLCFMGYLIFAYHQFYPQKATLKGALKNTTMFIMIALTLITGLSITGFMTPWWGHF